MLFAFCLISFNRGGFSAKPKQQSLLMAHTTVLSTFLLFCRLQRIKSSELTMVIFSSRAHTFSAAAGGHLTHFRTVSTLKGLPEDFEQSEDPPGESLGLPVFLPWWRGCSESQAPPHSHEVIRMMTSRPVYREQQKAWPWCFKFEKKNKLTKPPAFSWWNYWVAYPVLDHLFMSFS